MIINHLNRANRVELQQIQDDEFTRNPNKLRDFITTTHLLATDCIPTLQNSLRYTANYDIETHNLHPTNDHVIYFSNEVIRGDRAFLNPTTKDFYIEFGLAGFYSISCNLYTKIYYTPTLEEVELYLTAMASEGNIWLTPYIDGTAVANTRVAMPFTVYDRPNVKNYWQSTIGNVYYQSKANHNWIFKAVGGERLQYKVNFKQAIFSNPMPIYLIGDVNVSFLGRDI